MGSRSRGKNKARSRNLGLCEKVDMETLELEGDSTSDHSEASDNDDRYLCQSTVHYDETVPNETEDFTENEMAPNVTGLEGETQVFEDLETQVVEDLDFYADVSFEEVAKTCEAEEAGETEVLTESEGVSGDMPATSKLNSPSKKAENMCEVNSQKRHSMASVNFVGQQMKDDTVDFNGLTDEDSSSVGVKVSSPSIQRKISGSNTGCAKRSFTSVRLASLRSSGLAAARRSMTPKSAETDSYPVSGKSQALHDNSHTPPCSCGHIGNDNRDIGSVKWPYFSDTDTYKAGGISENELKLKSETRNPTVRKLFAMDSSAENDVGNGVPHGIAGLSYVDSQEPGEFSQTSALNVVDKYLHMNDMDSEGGGLPVHLGDLRCKSPSISVLKGRVSLAQRANPETPVVKTGIFEWVDAHGDGGRNSSSVLGRRDQLWKSQSEWMMSKHVNLKSREGVYFRPGGEEHTPPVHHKPRGFVCSESRLVLNRSREWKKSELPDIEMNNLSTMPDEPVAVSMVMDEHVTDPIVSLDAGHGAYDVGFDTQLAAEAMEALGCASPVKGDARAWPPSIRGTSGRAKNKDICANKLTKKRICSASYSERSVKTCKKRKLCGTQLTDRKSSLNQLDTAAKTDMRYTRSVGRSSKSCEQPEGHDYNHNERMDGCTSTSTPIAHRTRQSVSANPGQRVKNYSNNSRISTHCSMKFVDVTEGKNSFDVDALEASRLQEKSSKLDTDKGITIGQKNKGEMSKQIARLHVKRWQAANSLVADSLTFPKRRRSCRHWTQGKNKIENDHVGISPKENTSKFSSLDAVSPVYLGDSLAKELGTNRLSKLPLLRELAGLHSGAGGPSPALKEERGRDMHAVRVLLSNHLGENKIKQQKKILAHLRVPLASSPSDATHFIADKFARTRNMLETMALAKPVVTHLWLESCAQANCLMDETNYILRDHKKEKEIGFNMAVSLTRASEHPLLQGKRVFITQSVAPSRAIVAALVLAARGQAVETIGRLALRESKIPDNFLVVSCEEDYTSCVPLLEKGAEVYSSELVLNGIVVQKLEYERHRLFMDHVKKTRSTIWIRGEVDQQFHRVVRT